MPYGAHPKLVLIVDDFPESVDGLFEFLAEAGFSVALACDGVDGLEKARERRPDVVVVDLAMPRLNGLDLARRLKADPSTTGIPVVLYTGHAGDELRHIAEAAGCACVLGKSEGAGAVVDAVSRLCA